MTAARFMIILFSMLTHFKDIFGAAVVKSRQVEDAVYHI